VKRLMDSDRTSPIFFVGPISPQIAALILSLKTTTATSPTLIGVSPEASARQDYVRNCFAGQTFAVGK
jgi:hypothetical protein